MSTTAKDSTDSGSASIERVTFRHAFMLPGFDRPHPPGSFDVRIDREALDVSWPAYRLALTILLIDGAQLQAVEVKREDLDEALERDIAGPPTALQTLRRLTPL